MFTNANSILFSPFRGTYVVRAAPVRNGCTSHNGATPQTGRETRIRPPQCFRTCLDYIIFLVTVDILEQREHPVSGCFAEAMAIQFSKKNFQPNTRLIFDRLFEINKKNIVNSVDFISMNCSIRNFLIYFYSQIEQK